MPIPGVDETNDPSIGRQHALPRNYWIELKLKSKCKGAQFYNCLDGVGIVLPGLYNGVNKTVTPTTFTDETNVSHCVLRNKMERYNIGND